VKSGRNVPKEFIRAIDSNAIAADAFNSFSPILFSCAQNPSVRQSLIVRIVVQSNVSDVVSQEYSGSSCHFANRGIVSIALYETSVVSEFSFARIASPLFLVITTNL
jgi:hypothetical protein